jgi:hypothetical protein
MNEVKIRKVVMTYIDDTEVITYKDVARIFDISSTQARTLLHGDVFAQGRPTPYILSGNQNRYFIKNSEFLTWITPLVMRTRKNISRGRGRPRKQQD